jgi:flagellar basal-body rod modification protein FlgD
MATDAISASQINMQDFLRILVAQLNYQDPLKPMDNEQFVSQLAQFTSLQQTQSLNDKMGNLLSIQGAMQSVGLIGRTVDLIGESGQVTGSVTALHFSSGEPRLTVTLAAGGGVLTDVSLSNVVSVR